MGFSPVTEQVTSNLFGAVFKQQKVQHLPVKPMGPNGKLELWGEVRNWKKCLFQQTKLRQHHQLEFQSRGSTVYFKMADKGLSLLIYGPCSGQERELIDCRMRQLQKQLQLGLWWTHCGSRNQHCTPIWKPLPSWSSTSLDSFGPGVPSLQNHIQYLSSPRLAISVRKSVLIHTAAMQTDYMSSGRWWAVLIQFVATSRCIWWWVASSPKITLGHNCHKHKVSRTGGARKFPQGMGAWQQGRARLFYMILFANIS